MRRLPSRLHRARPAEAGVSIVLVLLLLLLLVVLVFRVDFAAHVESDSALHHVQETQMRYLAEACLIQAQSALLLDIEEAADGEGGEEEEGGEAGGLFGDGGGAGGDALSNAAEITATTDSLLDEWSNGAAILPPMGDDWEVFVEIEDEDAKINLLGIWTRNDERREEWRDVVRKLLDEAFEGSSLDLSALDAEDVLSELDEWARGQRGSRPAVPVPSRKRSQADDDALENELDTDIIDTEEVHFPLTLAELTFFEAIQPEHLMGFVEDDEHFPGLDHYLTLYSHLELKNPLDPDEDAFASSPLLDDEEEEELDEPELSADPTFDGVINVNRAPLKVLRALAPDDIPTSFLEAIIEFRERVLEESAGIQEQRFSDRREAADPDSGSMFDDRPDLPDDEEEDPTRFVFQAANEVFDKVEEEMDLSVFTDDEERRDFEARLGVESQVFTVKILISEPHDPSNPQQPVTTRSYRSVVWRAITSDGPRMISLLPLETYRESRRIPQDLPMSPDELADARRSFR